MRIYLEESYRRGQETIGGLPVVEASVQIVINAESELEAQQIRFMALRQGYLKHIEKIVCQAIEESEGKVA